MTLLILYIAKCQVCADNILCIPERLVDSDVRAWEGNMSLSELPIVTHAFVGGATESETGIGSLSSDFTMLNMTEMYKYCYH